MLSTSPAADQSSALALAPGACGKEPLRVAEFESHPHQNAMPILEEHRINLLLESDGGVMRQQRNGLFFEGARQAGDIDIIPAFARGHCHSQANMRGIEVRLPPALLDEIGRNAFDGDAPTQLSLRFAVRDEKLKSLITLLHQEARERPDAGNDAMRDSLTTALAIQLLRQHAHAQQHLNTREPTCASCGGLSAQAQNQVLQYIQSHLSGPISLDAAADVAGLSRFHFLRAFKTSFGITPHQFVIEQRVQRAKELMLQPQLTLREIAGRCGFSDQSHLTRHFRRLTGTTPKAFGDTLKK